MKDASTFLTRRKIARISIDKFTSINVKTGLVQWPSIQRRDNHYYKSYGYWGSYGKHSVCCGNGNITSADDIKSDQEGVQIKYNITDEDTVTDPPDKNWNISKETKPKLIGNIY